MRSLHLIGALFVIFVGGAISWVILEQVDRTEPNKTSKTPQATETKVELVELTDWQVALPVSPDLPKVEIIVSPQGGNETASTPSKYTFATKTSRESMQRCGIKNDALLTMRRIAQEQPPQLEGEFQAGTSRIGNYYYIYQLPAQTTLESLCLSSVRTKLVNEMQSLERMASAIQLM